MWQCKRHGHIQAGISRSKGGPSCVTLLREKFSKDVELMNRMRRVRAKKKDSKSGAPGTFSKMDAGVRLHQTCVSEAARSKDKSSTLALSQPISTPHHDLLKGTESDMFSTEDMICNAAF